MLCVTSRVDNDQVNNLVSWSSSFSLSELKLSNSGHFRKPGKVVKMRRYLPAHPLLFKFVEFMNKINKYCTLVLHVLSTKGTEVWDLAWLFVGDVTFDQRLDVWGQVFLFPGTHLTKNTIIVW